MRRIKRLKTNDWDSEQANAEHHSLFSQQHMSSSDPQQGKQLMTEICSSRKNDGHEKINKAQGYVYPLFFLLKYN